MPNFKALGIYFIFGTKFSWSEGIDTCFNVKCVLLGRNFDFFCGYFGGYCSLPLVTARYRLLRLVPIFSMNDYHQILRKICHVVTKAEHEVIILYEFEKL